MEGDEAEDQQQREQEAREAVELAFEADGEVAHSGQVLYLASVSVSP